MQTGGGVMRYGIVQDSKLILTNDTRQYGGEVSHTLAVTETTKEIVYDEKLKKDVTVDKVKVKTETAKPIHFAPIPKFDQETQAVYQDQPVDKGDVIDVGVIVVDLPEEKDLIDETEGPSIKK
jgi:hypothetical protein